MEYGGEKLTAGKMERTPNRKLLRSLLGASELRRRTRWGSEDFSDLELAEMRESVMEHIGGLLLVANRIYDQALTDHDTSITSLNWKRVTDLISVHDLAEIVTGDIVDKSEEEKETESQQEMKIITKAEEHLGLTGEMGDLLDRYAERRPDGSKTSPEDNFVKAIDEVDSIIKMIHSGRLDKSKRSPEDERAFFEIYAKDFPTVYNFTKHLLDVWESMKKRGLRGTYEAEDA